MPGEDVRGLLDDLGELTADPVDGRVGVYVTDHIESIGLAARIPASAA